MRPKALPKAMLGVATSVVNGVLIGVAHEVPPLAQALGLAVWQAGLGLFAIGWVIQFIGHYFEGRKPAFVDDLVGLLVGPMFVVGEVLMWAGLLQRHRGGAAAGHAQGQQVLAHRGPGGQRLWRPQPVLQLRAGGGLRVRLGSLGT